MSKIQLPCKCHAVEKNAGEYEIWAESFLCTQRHKQGELVDAVGRAIPVVHPDQTSLA